MPQAEDIAANGLGIVPDDPDWELYGFEYDPVPNVEVARKVREQLNAHLEHNRLIKNSVPNFSPNTSINLADFDPVPDRNYLNRRAAAAKSRMMDVLSIAKIEPPTRIEEGSMRMEKGQVPTSDDHVDKLRDSPNVEFSEALKRSYDGPVGFFGVRIRNSPYRPFIFDMINDFIQAEKDLHEFKERQQSRN